MEKLSICLIISENHVQLRNCDDIYLPYRKDNRLLTWHEDRVSVLELAKTQRGGGDAVVGKEISSFH